MSIAAQRPSHTDLSGERTWPPKVDIFGCDYSATTYDEAVDAIVGAVNRDESGVVSCHAAHAVVEATGSKSLCEMVNQFDMVTPDGQPVRWAMNILHRTRLEDRVYGPELMLRLCERAADERIPIYLYGGSPDVVKQLNDKLIRRLDLRIVGYESPPFRELTDTEDQEMVERVNSSGAGIFFIGLGCPKQDIFAFEHRHKINAVQICVGAAFDFHAGAKSMAPRWMQRRGLEWLFRLIQEPRRLCRRYLTTSTVFVAKLLWAMCNVPRVLHQRRQRLPSLQRPSFREEL